MSKPTLYTMLMVKKLTKNKLEKNIYKNFTTLLKAHFLFLGFYIAQIILFDAGKLIPPNITQERWVAASLFAVICAGVFYVLTLNKQQYNFQQLLVFIIAFADIAFAAFNVYITRGMASKAVFFFILAFATIALLRNLAALLFVATISAAVYISTAVSYFVNNFNEGYKIELYGEVGLYAACMYAVAYLFWAVARDSEAAK